MAFIDYKNKCIFHFCILRKHLDDSFPNELINIINYHYDKYIFICKLPYVCGSPGYYMVTKNLTCLHDVAIQVNAKNVDIDMYGYKITSYFINQNMCVSVNNENCNIHDGKIDNFLIAIGIHKYIKITNMVFDTNKYAVISINST